MFQAEIGNICLTGTIYEVKRAAQPFEIYRLCSSAFILLEKISNYASF